MICIDLFCGLGGWSEGFLAEGWTCIGFDLERHRYPAREVCQSDVKAAGIDFGHHDSFNGTTEKRLRESPLTGGWSEYPGQLVLQNVLHLHGSQFRNASVIVASPPCQEYSYMSMPWKRAKQIASALRGDGEFPEGYTGSRTKWDLTALFQACFRIQREASEAAGRHIPLVVENVKGAQPWVGRAQANYGSYYLWGDVASIGGRIVRRDKPVRFGELGVKAVRTGGKCNPDGTGHPQGFWFAVADSKERGARKVPGMNFHEHEKTGQPGRSFQSAAVELLNDPDSGVKQHGSGRGSGSNGRKVQQYSDPRRNVGKGVHLTSPAENAEGHKGGGDWFSSGEGMSLQWAQNSKSPQRKVASALIAKIPFPLAQYVARAFKP